MYYSDFVKSGTTFVERDESYLVHHGIKGQKWGVRRYQNYDGTLTSEGKERYGYTSWSPREQKQYFNNVKKIAFEKAGSRGDIGKGYELIGYTDQFVVDKLREFGRKYHELSAECRKLEEKEIDNISNNKEAMKYYKAILAKEDKNGEPGTLRKFYNRTEPFDTASIDELKQCLKMDFEYDGADVFALFADYLSPNFKETRNKMQNDAYNSYKEHVEASKILAKDLLGSYANKSIRVGHQTGGRTVENAADYVARILRTYTVYDAWK